MSFIHIAITMLSCDRIYLALNMNVTFARSFSIHPRPHFPLAACLLAFVPPLAYYLIKKKKKKKKMKKGII